MISNRLFAFSAEVRHALATHKPVVALESTIITHGMPMPSNLDTALAVERIIRERGAVPATIALIGGRVRVGLESSELEELADLNSGFKAVKASRRDLGLVLAKGWTGSTTVAATSLIANRVGIKVFVTGGIGGVHREGHISMDVSADLTELGRTPIAVVCAGIKSILDIPRTLEFLETQGVPVVSFGTKEFPAFYTPHSGVESIARMDSAEECASLIHAQDELGLQNGVVIGVPIPSADVEIDGAELEACIANALVKADKIGVKGKEVTPFLLSKVKDVTKGKSLNANIALIKSNARVGADIAVSLSKMRLATGQERSSFPLGNKATRSAPYLSPPAFSTASKAKVLIVGATNLDITAKFNNATSGTSKSAAGSVSFTLGGVGRNMAEACWRSGGNPHFVSAIANDAAGDIVLSQMKERNMPQTGIKVLNSTDSCSTAVYNGVLDSTGETVTGVADMTMHKLVANMADWDLLEVLRMEEPGVIAVDGNLSPSALTHCLVHSKSRNYKPIGVFEPTSVPKSTMLFNLLDEPLHPTWSSIQSTFTIVTPNAPELAAMHMEAQSRRLLVNLPLSPSMDEGLQNRLLPETQDAVRLAWDLAHIIQVQLVKLGAEGALIVSRSRDLSSLSLKPGSKDYACTMPNGVHVLHLTSRHDAALPIVSVTGAGDSLVGRVVTGLAEGGMEPQNLYNSTCAGLYAAALSLQTHEAVSDKLK